MKPFVTLGDLIADFYLGIERLPVEAAQHQTVSYFTLGPGGAGNALIAAARLGLPCIALGSLGDDWVGDQVLHHLKTEGVDVGGVVRLSAAPTAMAVVLRTESGEHVFLGYYGAHRRQELLTAWRPVLQSAGVVLVDGWSFFHDEPAVIRAGVELAAQAGVPVLFDPGPRVADIERDWLAALVRCAAVVSMTEDESQMLQRCLSPADLEPGARLRAVVVKRGSEGCVISAGGRQLVCPGYPVEERDPTGAGDCFAAAVAWGLLHGLSWEVIGAIANAVGAAKVQKIGTALAAPTREEVAAILRRHRRGLAEIFAQ
ncbi:MAG: carbohydrate kinase family protein [Anaerolineales bacterium]|nr:carbohydrate kinase family protein [Anaerolineales bacterium]